MEFFMRAFKGFINSQYGKWRIICAEYLSRFWIMVI